MDHKCIAILASGKHKEELCNKSAISGSNYCGIHIKYFVKEMEEIKGHTVCSRFSRGCTENVLPELLNKNITVCEKHYKLQTGRNVLNFCTKGTCTRPISEDELCYKHFREKDIDSHIYCANQGCNETIDPRYEKTCSTCRAEKATARILAKSANNI